MIGQWKDDLMHDGLGTAPKYVALSRLFVDGELKALVQFRGTAQRYNYTVTRFEGGSSIEVPGEFSSLEKAKAAVTGQTE